MTDQNNAAHDLGTSSGGRAYIAEYFATQLRWHDFATYINSTLAADFACALAQHLSKLRAEGVQAGDERERGYAENAAFRVWWDENQACLEHSLTTENAAHAAWQERGRRAALASAPAAGKARASQLEDPSKGGLIPEVRLRALALADTVPQASEAVRNAALEEAAALFDGGGVPVVGSAQMLVVAGRIRALKYQAEKVGSQRPQGVRDER
ncbi:hypothetical protein [Achromobacter kerstersii]|uniref:hypothetical protein n=1 Tax=Achromobacter kerstersii TaxID=1353890 RepID=UPI003D002B2B